MKRYKRHPRTLEMNSSASASDLQALVSACDRHIAETEGLTAAILTEKARRSKARAELLDLAERIKSSGRSDGFFGLGRHVNSAAKTQTRAINEAIAALDVDVSVGAARWSSIDLAVHELEARWSALQAERQRLISALETARRAEQKASRKQDSEALAERRRQSKADRAALDAALAARVKRSVRIDAWRVGKLLRRDHNCPYCGESLGRNPHKDHIHPVVKGGLSVETNLVYVCQPCNLAKRGDTLNQFIDRAGFDHAIIRSRLIALGKDC